MVLIISLPQHLAGFSVSKNQGQGPFVGFVVRDMFDRGVQVCLTVPRAVDRLVAWMILRLVLFDLSERPEFQETDASAQFERRGTVRMLNRELVDATSVTRRRAYRGVTAMAVTSVIAVWIVGRQLGTLDAWWARTDHGDVADRIRTLTSVLRHAGPAIVVVTAANVTVVVLVRMVLRWGFGTLHAWFRVLSERLTPELRMMVNAEATRSRPMELLVERTPGLSGRDLDVPWIERASARRVQRLITELGATSVAVSGRRGVGKTTLLRRALDTIVTPEPISTRFNRLLPPLSVFVQAPVDYAPKDFLVDLFAQVCETVIEEDPGRGFGPKSLPSRVIARIVRFAGRSACVALILMVIVAAPPSSETNVTPDPATTWLTDRSAAVIHRLGFDTPMQPGITLLTMLGLIGAIILLGVITKPGAGPLARRAAAELAQLRYLQTLQSERAVNLSRGPLGLGLRRARQLAQQPVTMPELVRRYRDFAEQVAAEALPGKGSGLLIAIDEMDRIANAESAEQFLNQIKATFDVPGCTYLVTVSEDALAQFERRVANLRTTVDTSFDEVVWLPDLSLRESMDLLRRRVTGFPDLFLALCFCLSGGVPRDLLRAARTLVDARHDAAIEHLNEITRAVVHREVQSFARGVLRSSTQADEAVEALVRLVINGRRTGSLFDVAEVFMQETADGAAGYSAVLDYYATIEHLFLDHREIVEAALAEVPDENALNILEDLATARALLPSSPRLAIDGLADILTRVSSTKTICVLQHRGPRLPSG